MWVEEAKSNVFFKSSFTNFSVEPLIFRAISISFFSIFYLTTKNHMAFAKPVTHKKAAEYCRNLKNYWLPLP